MIVRDYFTPHDQEILSTKDLDLGAGGPLLLPDQNGTHPHLVLVGGKDGNLFVIDRENMGKYNSARDDVVQIVKLSGNLHAAPAYWNQHVYVFGDNDVLHDLVIRDGKLQPATEGRIRPVNPGATPTVSANVTRDGIVWTVSTRTWEVFPERLAVLHAYNATDVSQELYNSEENSDRDRAGISVRFTIPSVVNGKVYVGGRSELDVHGLSHSKRKPEISLEQEFLLGFAPHKEKGAVKKLLESHGQRKYCRPYFPQQLGCQNLDPPCWLPLICLYSFGVQTARGQTETAGV